MARSKGLCLHGIKRGGRLHRTWGGVSRVLGQGNASCSQSLKLVAVERMQDTRGRGCMMDLSGSAYISKERGGGGKENRQLCGAAGGG